MNAKSISALAPQALPGLFNLIYLIVLLSSSRDGLVFGDRYWVGEDQESSAVCPKEVLEDTNPTTLFGALSWDP